MPAGAVSTTTMGDKKNIRIALIALYGLDFGARSISAFLKKNGHPVSLVFFDRIRYPINWMSNDYLSPRLVSNPVCDKKDLDLLIALLGKLDAKIIGISLAATTFQTAKTITLEIKKRLDVTVVWGGVHAIVCPEECIRYADIVCVGEGEYPMLELAERLNNNETLNGIGSLWIKNADGIEKNELNPLIEDLDKLPFPDFVDRDNKFVIALGRIAREYDVVSAYMKCEYPIMTSRGCSYACSFCSNSVLKLKYAGKGNYLRRRSVENVIGELKYAAANRQINTIRFWDDIFTYDTKWINEFCGRYLKEIGKPFLCYTHPLRTNREILTELREAGLELANIGLQSGSEELSKNLFSRPQTNRDVLEFARFAHKLGITVRYDVLGDNPYETDRDHERTIELLLQLPRPFQTQFHSLCWFPKTPLTEKALADKIITESDLEQYASKALNNFLVYAFLSRDKRSLFWNCITGMALNRLFPVPLTRTCMGSRFFKKFPGLLFTAGKWLIALCSKYSLTLKRNSIVLKKMTPLAVTSRMQHMLRDFVLDYGTVETLRWLFQRPAEDYSLFPLPEHDASKICLRIRNHAGTEKSFDFAVVLIPFGTFFTPAPPYTRWGMRVNTGEARETDVHIKLDYPELTCTVGGKQGITILRKKEIPALISGKVYSFILYHPKLRVPFLGVNIKA